MLKTYWNATPQERLCPKCGMGEQALTRNGRMKGLCAECYDELPVCPECNRTRVTDPLDFVCRECRYRLHLGANELAGRSVDGQLG